MALGLAMRTYNLFRRKGHADLVCAVPEDHPVPPFIRATTWVFGGTSGDSDVDPLAFNREMADASIRHIGFYLFQKTKALQVGRPAARGTDKDALPEAPIPRNAVRQEIAEALGRWRAAQARGDGRHGERMHVPAGSRCAP